MNREQKGAAIAEIAAEIEGSEAIFAVDYRGITVAQAAELRGKLRDADAKFKVVKNSLTERAADETGTEALKPLLIGPTALAFVKGDAALAAKAIADYARVTQMLPFKGGLMGGEALGVEQVASLSRLPAREVLYGQLVGIVASPVSGLVRTLAALTGGLAVALGQVREKKESGEIPAGDPPAAAAEAAEADAAPAAEANADAAEAGSAAAEAEPAAAEDEPAAAEDEPAAAEAEPAEAEVEAPAEGGSAEPDAAAEEPDASAAATDTADDAPATAEPDADAETSEHDDEQPAETAAGDDDTVADASAADEPQAETAEANKED